MLRNRQPLPAARQTLANLARGARAEAGEDIVITRNGMPVARLAAIAEQERSLAVVRGAWRGRMRMAEDFDELPEDIARSLGAR